MCELSENVDLVREGLGAFLGGTVNGGRVVRQDAFASRNQAIAAASA